MKTALDGSSNHESHGAVQSKKKRVRIRWKVAGLKTVTEYSAAKRAEILQAVNETVKLHWQGDKI